MDRKSAAEVWRAVWGDGPDQGDRPTPEEFAALLHAASRLPPEKLRVLIEAVRSAAPRPGDD